MKQQTEETRGETALKYFQYWSKKEYQASATLLDEHLSFKGPIDMFDNAKDYISSINRLGQIVREVRTKQTFVEGKDVCVIYDLVTNTPAGTVPCAEWIRADGGKVKAIQVFFDARPFAPMFEHK